MATAILVDGEFFLRRFEFVFPKLEKSNAKDVVIGLRTLAHWHVLLRLDPVTVQERIGRKHNLEETSELYRIFFYDCAPLQKIMHTPIGKRAENFGKSEQAVFRLELHRQLQTLRKLALRLGRLNDRARWTLKAEAVERLIQQRGSFVPDDADFKIDVVQKGVDMRLGLDVASLAFKKQVDQIVIVSADADFVPAAKLARREGIDVILDRMGAYQAASDLIQHVDGIRDSHFPNAEVE